MSNTRIHPFSMFLAAVAMVLALAAASPAAALKVTGGFTGWWGQPDQQNQGLIVAISRLPSGEQTGVIYWAHYTDSGEPTWLFAQGQIEDERIVADVFRFDGITFMQSNDPDANFGEQVGTMTVTFSDCLNGSVEFATDVVGDGIFDIARLTDQPGAVCSGGVSDDVRPGDLPQAFDIDLAPTDAFPDAGGRAAFDLRPGRADFSVDVDKLPAGSYALRVGEDVEGTIEVGADGSGSIEFRSPAIPGTELLDFDPRDRIIDVLAGDVIALTALAPAEGDSPGNGPTVDPAGGGMQIETNLENQGVHPDATAHATLSIAGAQAAFEVEVEDVPAGDYAIRIDGVDRGGFEVVERTGGTHGEIEFRDPAAAGERPLDFDPRGSLVEIVGGGEVLFSGVFPENPGGGPAVVRIEVELANSGVHPEGAAEALFTSGPQGERFVIEIEDVPAGTYALFVGAEEQASIEVEPTGDGTFGRARFGDPATGGMQPLDFDPRGTTLEIRATGTVIFSGLFPN